MSCSNGLSFTQSAILPHVVAHENILYFMGKSSILVIDPFNSDEKREIINFPSDASANDILFNGHVGVCRGKF